MGAPEQACGEPEHSQSVVSECLSEESAKKVKLVFRVAEAPGLACGEFEHLQSVVSECVSA